MDVQEDVDAIIAQAPEWNFAGDCAILELMKRISKNLQDRGERTSNNLKEFQTNVKRTEITLNNATNSLRALQFGQQFVEYRVEEVDDLPIAEEKKSGTPPNSSNMIAEFMQNNVEMFRKNFEPVNIEVPDSDDEDGVSTTTTIFRAKNPYDATPLPYIIGTKEWHEHKYAGLYDSAESSEDDQSEQFSSSSSDEKDITASKISIDTHIEPGQSDSSSITSMPKELASGITSKSVPIAVPATSASQAVSSNSQPRQIISSKVNPHQHDLFSALRQSPPSDNPPSTTSSPTSSPVMAKRPTQRLPAMDSSLSSSSSSAHKQILDERQPSVKLFEDTTSSNAITSLPEPEDSEARGVQTPNISNQIKRKPVNLFNDDDFNSLMSEIVDKVQTRTNGSLTQPKIEPHAQPRALHRIHNPSSPQSMPVQKPVATQEEKIPKKSVEPTRKTLNLFDDSPPLSPIVEKEPPRTSSEDQKCAKVPLFDDFDDVDDFLNTLTTKYKKPIEHKSKALFDDDDDDFDINDILNKKRVSPPKLETKPIATIHLFDDDDVITGDLPQRIPNVEVKPVTKRSPFEDDDDDADIFGSIKKVAPTPSALPKEPVEEQLPSADSKKEKHPVMVDTAKSTVKKISLFDDIEDDDLFADRIAEKRNSCTDDDNISNHQDKLNVFADTHDDGVIDNYNKNTDEKVNEIATTNPPEVDNPLPTSQEFGVAPVTKESFKELRDSNATVESADAECGLETIGDSQIVKSEITVSGSHLIKEEEKSNKNQSDDTYPIEQSKENEQIMTENIIADQLLQSQQSHQETVSADDDELLADPIITMVADISNKNGRSGRSHHTANNKAAAQQIMQNYTSLFSDEPPDDSEFFQTLGSSSLSSLNTSKIFDSEQDFFEPSLPELPSTSRVAAATAAAVTPPTDQHSSSDYSGMRLFSEVPPDDDADAGPGVESTATRIHTIFYDDFSETATAGEGSTEHTKPSSKASFFDNEPPPDLSNISSKAVDIPDHCVAGTKELQQQRTNQTSSQINKLKMPNIAINVQALLPGASRMSETKTAPDSSKVLDFDSFESKTTPLTSSHTSDVGSAIPSAENILQNINKTRARGPARRPSTRRARYENYEKSLLTETKVKSLDVDASVSTSEQSILDAAPIASTPILNIPSKVANLSASKSTFLDSDNDDDLLFGFSKTSAVAKPKNKQPIKPTPSTANQATASTSKLFGESEDDDDLFADKPNTEAAAKTVVATTKTSLFSSDEDEQEGESAKPLQKQLRAQKFKIAAPLKTSKSLFSDDDEDDDNLFGGGGPATSKPTKSAATFKSSQHRKVSKTVTSEATPSDNPLADLLDP